MFQPRQFILSNIDRSIRKPLPVEFIIIANHTHRNKIKVQHTQLFCCCSSTKLSCARWDGGHRQEKPRFLRGKSPPHTPWLLLVIRWGFKSIHWIGWQLLIFCHSWSHNNQIKYQSYFRVYTVIDSNAINSSDFHCLWLTNGIYMYINISINYKSQSNSNALIWTAFCMIFAFHGEYTINSKCSLVPVPIFFVEKDPVSAAILS